MTFDINNRVVFCTGTSYAAAFVSGLVAVIKAYNNYNNRQVYEIISRTVTNIGKYGKDNLFGYGIINYRKTLKYLEEDVK